ncbi:MAG: PhzF family phenazine biosynthesis protein [Asgard group archaeon]|nr:PhzF family phenazine biosynthesis protein [Asgard group archaeon]
MTYHRKMTTKQVETKIVDVFTSEPFQGNPIVVVPYGDSLTDKDKISIIREMNSNKGVFIGDSSDGKSDFRISVFTQDAEIDASYQGLIAAAFVMISDKNVNLKDGVTNILTEETKDGVYPLIVSSEGKDLKRLMVMLSWDEKPEFRRVEYDIAKTAEALGIESEDIRTDVMIQAVKMKYWSMVILVKDESIFDRVVFNRSRIINMATENEVDFICLVHYDPTKAEDKVFTRIFSFNLNGDSLFRQLEDTITGESNAAIAAYLFEHKLMATKGSKLITSFIQKSKVGRKGEIFVEIDIVNEVIKEICIGGEANIVLDGKMKLTPY